MDIKLKFEENPYGTWSWALYRGEEPIAAQGGFGSEDEARNGFRLMASAVFADAHRVQKLAFEAEVVA